MSRRLLSALILTSSLAFASSALADVPNDPPNTCFSKGEACDNAGNGQDQAGVCTSTSESCISGDDDCLRCLTEAEGGEAEGDGCAVSGTTRDGGILGAMLALGALGLFLSRRSG